MTTAALPVELRYGLDIHDALESYYKVAVISYDLLSNN